MAHIDIYYKEWCPYCHRAFALLDRKDVAYNAIDVDGKPDLQAEMAKKAGRVTVPQVFANGKPLGGYDDLAALEARGELDIELGLA